jgi:hypothetical protein
MMPNLSPVAFQAQYGLTLEAYGLLTAKEWL